MHRFAKILLTAIVASIAMAAHAQDYWDQKVTETIRYQHVRTAVQQLFRNRGSFVVDPTVNGFVEGTFTDVRLEDALQSLLRQVDGTYRIEGQIFRVLRRTLPEFEFGGAHTVAIPAPPKIVFTFKNTDVREAFAALFSACAPTFKLELAASVRGSISGDLAVETASEAIAWLARRTNTTVRLANGVFVVEPQFLFDFHGVDVRDALRQIFRYWNKNYTVAPDVHGVVTGQFTEPAEALFGVLDQAGCSVDSISGIVRIRIQEPTDSFFSGGALKLRKAAPNPSAEVGRPRISQSRTPSRMAFTNVDIKDALATFFTRVPGKFSIDPGLSARVTADLSNMSIGEALSTLANLAKASVELKDGVFYFRPRLSIEF